MNFRFVLGKWRQCESPAWIWIDFFRNRACVVPSESFVLCRVIRDTVVLAAHSLFILFYETNVLIFHGWLHLRNIHRRTHKHVHTEHGRANKNLESHKNGWNIQNERKKNRMKKKNCWWNVRCSNCLVHWLESNAFVSMNFVRLQRQRERAQHNKCRALDYMQNSQHIQLNKNRNSNGKSERKNTIIILICRTNVSCEAEKKRQNQIEQKTKIEQNAAYMRGTQLRMNALGSHGHTARSHSDIRDRTRDYVPGHAETMHAFRAW